MSTDLINWHGIPEEYQNQIVTGDARELSARIPDESIDMIFTDPPYIRNFMYLYDWLAYEATRILKPDGFVIAYTGAYWKSDVMAMMAEHLDYYFDFILVNRGQSPIMWQRKVISRHKSLIAYCKKDSNAKPQTNVLSLWYGGGEDKRYHTWGQDESGARYYLDCFTKPGQIVFDPFCGGGTIPAVSKVLSLNYVAFEIEEDAANIARERIRTTQPPLFVPQPQQLQFEHSGAADV